jgi:poly(3-hydroxybutyrate) depolymerase
VRADGGVTHAKAVELINKGSFARNLAVAALLTTACTPPTDKGEWKLTEGQSLYPVLSHNDMQANVLVFLPRNFGGRKWPVILYLHGAAQRGEPADELRNTAIAKQLRTQPDFPFIVVSPQLAVDAPRWDAASVHALLDEVLPKLPADSHRLYATGTSMGGAGVWRAAFERPARFAAIAPVATADRLAEPCRIRRVPVWAFHNALDNNFPALNDVELVDALNRCGGKARMTLYQKSGHDAWTQTYANRALYDWFLSQPPTVAEKTPNRQRDYRSSARELNRFRLKVHLTMDSPDRD